MDNAKESSRKDFIKMLSKSLGATIANHPILDALAGNEDVLRLNPEQQEFMLAYGKWMDENIEVIQLLKTEPGNMEHHKRMMRLSDSAEEKREQLTQYMTDRNFALIYHASIQKMKDSIGE